MRHKQGEDRFQTNLLPDALEDYVADDHPVRVIDAFVDTLDLEDLGFTKARTKSTGRKPYDPSDLLKLYVYGYFNQVHSSRRLEKECHRNLEVLWLMRRLAPDFKTIADFRKENGPAVRRTCRAFIRFCCQSGLLMGRLIAIDGSKFKAAASKDQALTRKQLQRDRKQIDAKIEQYLARLEKADREDTEADLERDHVQRAVATLRAKAQRLDEREALMNALNSNQHCETEPEAKLMRSGRDGMVLGYNLQSAVDADSGLIVHHDLTDESDDSRQLLPMATQTKDALDRETLEVIADAGYSNGEHLDSCERQGITATVPRRPIPGTRKDFYQKRDFSYHADGDYYVCPAGEILGRTGHDKHRKHKVYARTGCSRCSLQSSCTRSDRRSVTRHFFEAAWNRSQARLKANPQLMWQRMAIVERPFAVLKQAIGLRRFKCRGIKQAETEASIAVLGYNLKRMIELQGVPKLLAMLS